mmetsp:Transcript_35250/g.35776  ORF Transcript_35250/g.35776 Transcript_35250/m.35776 type:complete len:168 (+) Transcript_35250:105-608(+)
MTQQENRDFHLIKFLSKRRDKNESIFTLTKKTCSTFKQDQIQIERTILHLFFLNHLIYPSINIMKLSLSSLSSITALLVLWFLADNMPVTEGGSLRGAKQNEITNESRKLGYHDGKTLLCENWGCGWKYFLTWIPEKAGAAGGGGGGRKGSGCGPGGRRDLLDLDHC